MNALSDSARSSHSFRAHLSLLCARTSLFFHLPCKILFFAVTASLYLSRLHINLLAPGRHFRPGRHFFRPGRHFSKPGRHFSKPGRHLFKLGGYYTHYLPPQHTETSIPCSSLSRSCPLSGARPVPAPNHFFKLGRYYTPIWHLNTRRHPSRIHPVLAPFADSSVIRCSPRARPIPLLLTWPSPQTYLLPQHTETTISRSPLSPTRPWSGARPVLVLAPYSCSPPTAPYLLRTCPVLAPYSCSPPTAPYLLRTRPVLVQVLARTRQILAQYSSRTRPILPCTRPVLAQYSANTCPVLSQYSPSTRPVLPRTRPVLVPYSPRTRARPLRTLEQDVFS